jgi:hypothetical protein
MARCSAPHDVLWDEVDALDEPGSLDKLDLCSWIRVKWVIIHNHEPHQLLPTKLSLMTICPLVATAKLSG